MFCEFMKKFRRLVLIALGRFYEEREEIGSFSPKLFVKYSQNIHITFVVPTISVRVSETETEGKTLGYSISQTTLKK